MKKISLILIALLSVYLLNAQIRRTTAMPAKKFSGVEKSFVTQGVTAACDTLKIDSARNFWSSFYYAAASDGSADDGYSFGVSRDVDGISIKQDANYYDVTGSDYNYITGGLVDFAVANSNVAGDLNKNIVFSIYDDAGGYPGNLLASANVPLSTAKADVNSNSLTEFKFTTPVQIPANKIFYVSVDHSNFTWSNSARDSLAIVADSTDQAPAAAYQYWAIDPQGSQWIRVYDFYVTDTTNQTYLNVNLFLFPYVSNSLEGCATLPVSILNFKGNIKDDQAFLSWNTATEFNNKGFEIEKSTEGKNFKTIGFMKGAGTSSSLKKYSFTDATITDAGNTNYYRLKQVDFDGKTSYSKIISLSLSGTADWKTYPNPVKDKLTIELNLTADTKVSVQIISKDGKLLLSADKGMLTQGHQQFSLNIQNVTSGSYFVRIKAGNKNYTQTIIKQ